jgi:putative transposase
MEYRRHLPHFHPHSAFVFLTWRLWGSLPARPDPTGVHPSPGHAFVASDHALDHCQSGSRWLEQPPIANLVAEAIQTGNRDKHFYELRAWVLMPNHAHLLILPKVPVPVIMRWLKGSTARRANQLLGRTGQRFWQDESFDHWVRHNTELDRIVQYIEENPVTAGLAPSAELWPWSSAGHKLRNV